MEIKGQGHCAKEGTSNEEEEEVARSSDALTAECVEFEMKQEQEDIL
jgi:hypothetical protein